jgi:hypothetical protein
MCDSRTLRMAVGWFVISLGAIAQESVPSDPVAALRPAMMELQKGSWTPDAAKRVIETLVGQKCEAAAGWWTTLSEEALKEKKLPASFDASIRVFRKQCEAQGATGEDRKLVQRTVRHLESVVASRNFDEAKKVAAMAKLLLMLAPDQGSARALDAADKKIQGGNSDPSNLARQQKQFSEIEAAALPMIKARLERLFTEYNSAGCKPGRLFLKGAIKSAAGAIGDQQSQTWYVDLAKAARAIEPTLKLSLLMRPLGEIRLFRDGAEGPLLDREPIELDVLRGELLQFRVPRYSKEDDKRAFYVAAVSARLDGKDLGAKNWFLNDAANPLLLDPALRPTQVLRVNADDSRLKEILKTPSERGGFLAPHGERVVAVNAEAECVEIEKEFADRKVKGTWLGTFGEACVLVLRIPDA